ncbi:6-phospho-beta-glucosidase [Tessaracoccus caeni]|uniref:6-phospho-beta-glucosidase n=1 Tax=Tessaracoccus caeni TaxID=3031239 RepID=UPI0023DBDBA5|nr:6-phospho-beta-glucosidase [Tessaracoccus caeni]MDF1489487.1 6-phospho-beta-glucosidase [Tessaracoccus caeni]
MRLTIIGGGGFRVPLVYKALLADRSAARVTELRLYDTDERRLQAIADVLRELEAQGEQPPKLVVTTDAEEALTGTDFIFSAMRVGGTHARALDEVIALGHGVIGQETVGAGGISYALRCIPAVLDLVAKIQRYAPDAWVMNFTNPAGVVTEVMRRHLGDKVVGICDSPLGLARRALDALRGAGIVADDVPQPDSGSERIRIGYAGLNHLGWITTLEVDGVDVLPELLARPDLIESFEEGRLFGARLIQALGALPNEYLHYYYYSRDTLAVDKATEKTRGVFLEEQQGRFYEQARPSGEGAYELWEKTRREREETYMSTNREAAGSFERDAADLETGGYDQVALAIMHAIANDEPAHLILNVANGGLLPELDDDAVIEVPCRVDGAGVTKLPGTALPEHGRGLVINAKSVERYTIRAATGASRDDALLAFTYHPLIGSFSVAEKLLDDLIDASPELAYLRDAGRA